MDIINKADENELQNAINSIGSSSGSLDNNTNTVPEGSESISSLEASHPPTTSAAASSSSDLSKVKSMALSDLRPVLESVSMPPESKFKLYKDIIGATDDKASIEPAYTAAKSIANEKDRAEALLFIIETIDKLGM